MDVLTDVLNALRKAFKREVGITPTRYRQQR